MIDVATLSVIRRWALREQLSIREIARRTGINASTVSRLLATLASARFVEHAWRVMQQRKAQRFHEEVDVRVAIDAVAANATPAASAARRTR